MSIPIPYAMEYTSTMSGSVLKLVRCEQCETEYVYQLERTAEGQGTSFLFTDNEGASARASSRAEETLRRKLERGVDLVPCLACGWYQQDMIPRARREHRRWMFNVGACLTVGLIPVAIFGGIINAGRFGEPAIPWPVFVAILVVLATIGIGLMVAKFIGARTYDPNGQDVETRKQLGQARAVLRADLEAQLRAQHANNGAAAEKSEPPAASTELENK
ncbi:MAG TPA: hypothetical protein VHR66_22530 [Gemmataceae bacterium]|jgi:Zn ribbon nucleic-acid-binding protein|nr:hypothetical protein [Gemmataceae bacterium]